MRRVFIDANVFLYALGVEHPYRAPCRALVKRIARRELAAETSAEVLQEVVHIRRRRAGGASDAIARVREIIAWELPVHALTKADLELSLDLLSDAPDLPTRDAIHAATASNREITAILSADPDFDSVDRVQRIDPADRKATDRLTSREHT